MRIAYFSAAILLAVTAFGCSHSTNCGATPSSLCAQFEKLSNSLTEQERTTVISLITMPTIESSVRDKAVGRAREILNLGRNDDLVTYLGSLRVEGDYRVYQAVLCSYAQWLQEGRTNMNELLKDGLGRCWTTPKPVIVPIIVN